jgi:hypothetical protein
MLQELLYDQAVALGLVADEGLDQKRAAVGDPSEPVDLAEYRRTKAPSALPSPGGTR